MKIPALESFTTFGDLLRYLRQRQRLTQRDLGLAVGYGDAQITRLERNTRLPDVSLVVAQFIPALHLEDEPEIAARLIELAAQARGEPAPESFTFIRSNLPAQLTSFIGREREIAELAERVRTTRLLTLTGSGGCGKSRLALEVAARAVGAGSPRPYFEDGAWLVEFAPIAEAALVPRVAAGVFSLTETAGTPPIETLVSYLASKHLLLLFDNCEHLIEACAQLAERILCDCPYVHLLATSRETLHITGEVNWRVPSLTTPDVVGVGLAPTLVSVHERAERAGARPAPTTTTELLDYESIRLFVERARAIRPEFDLTDYNAASIAHICQRLDGMPLAIELAAARLNVLSPEQIAERLDDRFSLLTSGSRTGVPRHQTLRAAISWSFDLLTSAERDLFMRLSVFAGGFTAEAAEAVFDHSNILDLLSSLVDKSLVIAEVRGEAARYRMLETIRELALERLIASAEADATWRKHAQYFLQLAEEAGSKLYGEEQVAWLDRLEADHDNLRAVLRYAKESREIEVGLRLVGALNLFWIKRGNASEARNWIEGMSALAGVLRDTAMWAKALQSIGEVSYWQEVTTSQVRPLFEESLKVFRALGDKQGISEVLWDLGLIASDEGNFALARSLHQESLMIGQALGNQKGIREGYLGLGLLAMAEGDYTTARFHLEKSLAMVEQLGPSYSLAFSLVWLGLAALRQGDSTAARARFEKSVAIRREVGDKAGMSASLEGLAGLAAAQGQAIRAARLFGAAQAVRDTFGARMPASERTEYEHNMAAARALLDDAAFNAAWAEGRAMTMEQAVEYALSEFNE
jgi:non-specific serine/threonine protein kinase